MKRKAAPHIPPRAALAPDAITIKLARSSLGLTQRQAAIYAMSTLRSWQQWEQGHRLMHPAIWSYFLMSTLPLCYQQVQK